MEPASKLKTVLLGVGAALLAGALYYLTREVEVDGPTPDNKPKPKPQAASKPQPKPKPQSRPQPRVEYEHGSLSRAQSMQVSGTEPKKAEGLVDYEQGVITTDSLLKVLNVMKDKYWQEMSQINRSFRQERREILHQDLARYEALVKQWEKQQGQTFGLVFLSTLEDFGLKEADFGKYGQKHGSALLMSHMQRITMAPNPTDLDESTTAETVQEILTEHLRLLKQLYAEHTYKMMNSFMAEDLLYEKYHMEIDQITALGQKYKEVPEVKALQAEIAAVVGGN